MDNSRQPPRVEVAKHEDGDLVRQSSLLPGEVRTPTMVVTLSGAWDVSGDWAAPGNSVWEEEAPSRASVQTPLTGYGHEGDVWASATGSPLLGDHEGDSHDHDSALRAVASLGSAARSQAGHQPASPEAEAAELAAAALQAFVPHAAALHEDPHGMRVTQMPPPSSAGAAVMFPQQRLQLHQPRYAANVPYNYEGRFGTVQTAVTSDPIRGQQGVALLQHPGVLAGMTPPPHQQPQQQQQQPNYFTVQEGTSTRSRGAANPSGAYRPYGVPVMAVNGAAVPAGVAATPLFTTAATAPPAATTPTAGAANGGGGGGVPYVPRLDDEEVAQSIIASAGLPLSMQSLVDYIRGGQPQGLGNVSAMGTTHNALRNYPNLNEPPGEEEGYNNNTMNGGAGGGNGRIPQPSYRQPQPPQQQQQGRYGQPSNTTPAQGTGFAVRGSDASGSDAGGGFVVSAGNGPVTQRTPNPPHAAFAAGGGGGGYSVQGRHKSESEYLSDLLHFHANFFPPPPPPRVPKEERRTRAELWYHYASKWDITHRLPPPPRTPLPEMELEYRMRLQPMTRVPYHGDGWLQMGERWFDVTQTLFDFPMENVGDEVDFNVVLQQAVLG